MQACEKAFDFGFESQVLDKPALQRLMYQEIAEMHPEILRGGKK